MAKQRTRAQKQDDNCEVEFQYPPCGKQLKPLNRAQGNHLAALKSQTCVFSTGPAGTGKTFLTAAYAAQQLRDHEISHIVVTRPTVEAGSRGLGYLPGDLHEKYAVWIAPFLKGFNYILGKSYYEYLYKIERIIPCPLQYCQGLSFGGEDDATIVLADEFENASLQELKMLLTRVGDNTKIFLGGDTQQIMTTNSGFSDAIGLLRNVPSVSHIQYTRDDIVRSNFVRHVLDAFEGVSYADRRLGGVFAPT
jgi:phosphate starvation-inducible PhoH-like protein